MAKSMDDAFNVVLLQDLAGSTLLLGLTSYLVIVVSCNSFCFFFSREKKFTELLMIVIIISVFIFLSFDEKSSKDSSFKTSV